MGRFKALLLAGFLGSLSLTLGTPTLAAQKGGSRPAHERLHREGRHDRKEIRGDRRNIRHDRGDLRRNVKELRNAKGGGARPGEITHDKQEIRGDSKELRAGRRELRQDRKELGRDRRELKRDLKEGVSGTKRV